MPLCRLPAAAVRAEADLDHGRFDRLDTLQIASAGAIHRWSKSPNSRGHGRAMSRIDVTSSDGRIASSGAAAYVRAAPRTGPIRYMPGFLFILALFIVGKFIFPDPRATLVEWGQYHLSWVEVLLVGAAMMAMAEQLRVSYPGVDNTIEAILMGAVAGIQVLLFALGAAGVEPLAIFNNTEFIMLTLISLTQAVVAILINARTLRRTIGVGDNG
jgi:hypothetical protein